MRACPVRRFENFPDVVHAVNRTYRWISASSSPAIPILGIPRLDDELGSKYPQKREPRMTANERESWKSSRSAPPHRTHSSKPKSARATPQNGCDQEVQQFHARNYFKMEKVRST